MQIRTNSGLIADNTKIKRTNTKRQRVTVKEVEELRAKMQGATYNQKTLTVRELLDLKRFENGLVKAIADFKKGSKRVIKLKPR